MATKTRVRSVLCSLVAAIGVGAAALVVTAGPAGAQTGSIANATGIIVNGGRIAPADCPPGGGTNAPGGNFGLVTVGAVTANCTNAGAQASAVNATIGTCPACLQLGLIQSQCTTGPGGTASSSVLVLSGPGLGQNQVITGTTVVDVGLLRVVLNEPINTATTRGFNAVHVTGLGVDVIIAQTQCTTQAGYPLSSGIDTNPVVQKLAPASEVGSGTAPPWLVVSAALAVLLVVNVVFMGSVRRRRVARAS